MKVNRKDIENQIYSIINNKILDNETLMQVISISKKKHKGLSINIIAYLNYSKPLNLATDEELYIICDSLNQIFSDCININEIFTSIEINSYNDKKILVDEFDFSYKKIVFENVFMVNQQHFIANLVQYEQFYNIMNQGLLTYNFNTQRQAKCSKYNNNELKKPFLNQNSVKEIFNLMLKNEFYSNAISFNVRYLTGVEEIEYNKAKKQLSINISDYTYLDIVDGYHRLIALIKAYKKQANNTMQLNIFHHTESNINRFIIQESRQNKINSEHLIKLNDNDEWVALARAINDTGNTKTNVLHKKIMSTNNTDIDLKDFIKRLKLGFERHYNNPSDAIAIKNYIISGFNELYVDNKYESYKKTFEALSKNYKGGDIY
jgi:hypothetical protein